MFRIDVSPMGVGRLAVGSWQLLISLLSHSILRARVRGDPIGYSLYFAVLGGSARKGYLFQVYKRVGISRVEVH